MTMRTIDVNEAIDQSPFGQFQWLVVALCGTLLVVFVQIPTSDIAKTILLAIIGAIASFTATVCLKWIKRKIEKRKRGE